MAIDPALRKKTPTTHELHTFLTVRSCLHVEVPSPQPSTSPQLLPILKRFPWKTDGGVVGAANGLHPHNKGYGGYQRMVGKVMRCL